MKQLRSIYKWVLEYSDLAMILMIALALLFSGGFGLGRETPPGYMPPLVLLASGAVVTALWLFFLINRLLQKKHAITSE